MEQTGHDHHALLQYLLDLDIAVHLIHVQERTAGLLKTAKRDALGRANRLSTQLELGAQVADQSPLVRRAVPPLEAAALLRGLVRHRYELVHEATRRKKKLTAICDELFPAFATLCKDPNAAGALALREAFPTPHAVATATQADLVALRVGAHPSTVKLRQLHAVAATSIGVHDLGRQRGLALEQRQFIREVRRLQTHSEELDAEIRSIVASSREGRILTSMPVIGPLQAATILAAIGHIDNFASAAALRAYCGWAPQVKRSGETVDQVKLTRGGTRTMKQTLYLVVANAIQRPECEWARLYHRLAPRKCSDDASAATTSVGSAPSAQTRCWRGSLGNCSQPSLPCSSATQRRSPTMRPAACLLSQCSTIQRNTKRTGRGIIAPANPSGRAALLWLFQLEPANRSYEGFQEN
jgi:transposase